MYLLSFFLILMAGVMSAMSQGPSHVFLLAGQSNMSGRGGVINDTKTNNLIWDGQVPPESTPNSNILTLDLDKTWKVAQEPLHRQLDRMKSCGIGPGMPFAHEILAKDPSFGAIGLVPCAMGGTKIAQWQKGTALYNLLVTRAKTAIQSGGKLQGLLWYQGESDCGEQEYELYKARTETFFTDLRVDLNIPDLPIIMVVIASAEGNYMNAVRNAEMSIKLKNVLIVDAMGSTFIQDQKHLDTVSQIRLGQKLADKFLSSFPH
ncbi:hypothetical protein I3842_16G051400 [Carya illinoinensis]|uniref:Sialate O-acetylesterase domain-containing protein n=1 Tax=Carya illinoinensis TaxID=32201 RepID=A0A922A067_CARIL|nr:hypothetical protein I3842_16G051400 [Carya illinoinensis]